MTNFDKYRSTIIKKYGSWDNYQKERKRRMVERHGSEEAVIELQKSISSRGGKMSTSRPFRDIEGLAERAEKLSKTGKDKN